MYIGVSAMPSRSCRFSQTGVVEKMRLCDQAPYYCKEACKSAHAEGPGDGMSRGSTVHSGTTGRQGESTRGKRKYETVQYALRSLLKPPVWWMPTQQPDA
jgi:hypothetical protein